MAARHPSTLPPLVASQDPSAHFPPEASPGNAATPGGSAAGRPFPVAAGSRDLARRAARAALIQQRRGDVRSLRELYAAAFSFLRYFHHHWRERAA